MPKDNQTHIIEKQIVEITADKYETAQHLQNDVSRLIRYTITPALEKICNKYNSTDDIIRIDRMELDIGKLPLLEFDKLFCENSVEQFENKLEDIIAEIYYSDKTSPKQKGTGQIGNKKEANENQQLSETDKQFEILVQFLKTGNLPWHQFNNGNFDISELFMSLYEKHPEKLSVVLRTLFKSKIVLKRFIYQFPKKIKQSTAELFLSRSQGRDIAELASIFIAYQHLYENIGQNKKYLQYAIWDVILSRAIQQPLSLEKIIDQIATLIFHKISDEKNSNTRTRLLKSLITTGGIKHLKKLRFKNEFDKKALSEVLEQIESYEFVYVNKESEELIGKHLKDSEIQDKTHLKKEEGDELRMSEDKYTNNENLTESTEYNIAESSPDKKNKKKKRISQNTKDQKIENEEEKELTKKEDLTLKKLQEIDPLDSGETNIKEAKSTLPDEFQQEQNQELIVNSRSPFLEDNEDIISNKNKTCKKDTSEAVPGDHIDENVSGKLSTYDSTKEMSDSQEFSVPGSSPEEPGELKSVLPKVRASQEEDLVKKYLISKSVDEIIIENAGLVILWPYLPSLFKELDLLDEEKQFKDEQSRHLAVAISQYLVTSSEAVQEYGLTFNKLLCGIDLEEPIPVIEELSENIKQCCQELLEVVVKNWTALKGTSVESLQSSFLQREGILTKAVNGWKVQIERITFDILLDRLPWSISIIALPWRKELIYVEW